MLINGVEYSMGRPVGPWTQETWTEFVKRLDEIKDEIDALTIAIDELG
mgnify:CR=1 FL=1